MPACAGSTACRLRSQCKEMYCTPSSIFRLKQNVREEKTGSNEMITISKTIDFLVSLSTKPYVNSLVRTGLTFAPRPVRQWARWQVLKRGQIKLVPEAALEEKYEQALRFLAERHGPEGFGDYLEFGVFCGASMACMWRALQCVGLGSVRLFGFDSFEGLPAKTPEDSELPWEAGTFKSDYGLVQDLLEKQGVDSDRVFLVKGWYQHTLNEDLRQRHKIAKACIIMIDCDFYSSAKEALNFCGPLIQDEVMIFFDDWDAGIGLADRDLGEKAAFDEFLREHPDLSAQEFGTYYHTEMGPRSALVNSSKIFLVTRRR